MFNYRFRADLLHRRDQWHCVKARDGRFYLTDNNFYAARQKIPHAIDNARIQVETPRGWLTVNMVSVNCGGVAAAR